MLFLVLDVLTVAAASKVPAAPAPLVTSDASGQYLEVRTCDVYTGPCFANAEVNETGKEATLGWKFEDGAIRGVDVAGLEVVAVIRNENTLGKPQAEVKALETAIFVDSAANDAQRDALATFAKERLGDHATQDPIIRSAPIELATGCCDKAGCATLAVGDEIEVSTRCVCEHDKHCGNEWLFYPPLTADVAIVPAVATVHRVQSESIRVRFTDRESRSAMTGRFTIDAVADVPPTNPTREYDLKAIEEDLPKDVPEAFGKLLEKKALRLSKGDKPVYEIWLRPEIPFLAKPKTSVGIKFGQIAIGEFLGVARLHAEQDDYREDHIKPGVYALRYGIQPEDGDHLGTAPNRDFVILTSFKDDQDVAPIGEMDKLGELSILAGEDHPLICHLRPAEGDVKAAAALRHDDEKSLWIVDLTLTGKEPEAKEPTRVRAGLVLIGVSDAL